MNPIRHVLVANRGEIARRVFRTCRDLGIATAAVFSEADRAMPHVREADRAFPIPGYLDADAILAAAKRAGADAIHPGYGFLSENAGFAEQVAAAGFVWIGPPPSAMRALGDKAAARKTAAANGVPTVPGYDGADASTAAFTAAAERIGFPVLIKASAGGGGRGMRRIDAASELADALDSARREALAAFGSDVLLLEKYVERPRHIEVQILGDQHGNVVHLFERECSIQRRHQKIIEEAPSSAVTPALRAALGDAAVRVARAAGYSNAGTVEFLVDRDGSFYLLELNARLQVEHPVTELVTGLDLVALQLAIAEGRPLPFAQDDLRLTGHAIEVRLCAEDPNRDFLPVTGPIVRLDVPLSMGTRADVGYETGGAVGPLYDSMLGKLIAWGPDRASANRRLQRLVRDAWVPGIATNLPLLREILAHPAWQAGELDTAFLARNGLPTPPPLNLERGAVAATVIAWATRRAPSEIPTGWRVEGPATAIERWRCGESEVEVGARAVGPDALEIRIGWGVQVVRVLGTTGDWWRVDVDGAVEHWRVASASGRFEDGDLVYVHLGDGEAFVQLVPRFPAPVTTVEPGSLTSPTPGKVVAVRVVAGDTVAKGAILVVIEAMKMEHRVVAPDDGVIAQVRVAPGDIVDQGALLVRMEV
jgi:propionyl-CoA carboxylase alpha chain